MQRGVPRLPSRWLTRMPVVAAAALACGVTAANGGAASAAPTIGHSVPAAAATAYPHDWPMVHRTPNLQGWATNSSVTTANAASLGVKWATDLYGAAVDSPVVAYDPALKERLAYIGTQNGDMVAVNVATGQIVWSTWLGSGIRSSPVVFQGAVFAATYNSSIIYKLDAATGAVDCSLAVPQQVEGSPVAATPPGGVPTVYFGANDTETASGPLYAINATDCSQEWAFTGYAEITGSWDPLAYAVDANGDPLILFGTSDPDSAIYALNAKTGAQVWRYAVYDPSPGTYDVGSGVVVAPPGVNGSADGMAYAESKYGIMYALDLTTGAKIWAVNYNKAVNSHGRNISTAARAGRNLVLGDANGLVDLNAFTGKAIWSNQNPADTGVDSSPAIAGPAGSQVVAVGDLAGGFDVDSLATGAQLYHYQTGEFITASPAVSGGDILIASADGFLYDFAVGGGNETTLPASTITSPADFARIANPNGDLRVSGMATDQAGVSRVVVAIQANGPEGPWWDAGSAQWVSGPVGNTATLASPRATSSKWTFSYPVPSSGGAYQVTAYAVSTAGQSSAHPAQSTFSVKPSTTNPQVKVVPIYAPPGSTVKVSGSGYADSEAVDISLLGQTLGTATSTATGAVPATTVTVPLNAPFGLTSLTVAGETSHDVTNAPITIANKWAQFGYDPGRSGFEANDPSIFNDVAAGNGTYMNLAWSYHAAAAISAPPAVANGVAYTPDAAGDLTAIDIHNGAPLWTWTIGSGAALDGAPAVDTAKGLVFVGASDGTLNAISTASPKLVWSDALAGQVFAPLCSGGRVYAAASSGALDAVSEKSGAVLWSQTLASAIATAPSLDVSGKVLVVGESGAVQALSTAGDSLWTFSVPNGDVPTAPAAVLDGTVYVGAGDSVYALDEATGNLLWSYSTGGSIGNSLALSATHDGLLVTAGSADGNLYALRAADGTLAWKLPLGAPVTGAAAAFATYLFDTSTGVVGAGRITIGERLWRYATSGGATTPPVVVDGAVYMGAQDGNLYAFTSDGQPPT